MLTRIKGDEEQKQTVITFVVDWNEKNANQKITDIVNMFCDVENDVEAE